MIEIDTTPLSILFAFFGAFYSLLLVAVLRARRRRRTPEGLSTGSRFSLMVPARNEESVLDRTINGVLSMDYPGEGFEILVVDDGSTDRTSEIAARWVARHPGRISVIHIPQGRAGQGKAEALNFGFRHLLRTSRFNGRREWVIGVFDADGVPDADLLQKAASQFENPKVGAVQASVRIANRGTSRLARMQDIEFSAFSRVTQMIRGELLDSASLGGNGQFVRARALYNAAISRKPHRFWRPGALTEDLELSARLVLRSWRIKHLATSYVHQEGVERLGDLFRQRTRWAWGSLQVFVEYILKLRFIPIVTWGMWDQKEYRKARLPLDLLLFTVYTYHWLPCLYVAALRVIGGDDPKWFKTRRIAEAAARRSRRHRLSERISTWATAPRVAALGAFLLLVVIAGYLRWVRGGLLDPFEDPYQHWWIAG